MTGVGTFVFGGDTGVASFAGAGFRFATAFAGFTVAVVAFGRGAGVGIGGSTGAAGCTTPIARSPAGAARSRTE